MLQIAALAELILCWIAWMLAFVKPRRQAALRKKVARASESRLGMILVAVGFAMIWAYVRPPGFEKSWPSLIASMILGPPSVALAWAATRHLGKQWSLEASLREDHELIQTGPYRWVRHPIYTSIVGMLLATGAGWTWWPMFVGALIAVLAGTDCWRSGFSSRSPPIAPAFGPIFRSFGEFPSGPA